MAVRVVNANPTKEFFVNMMIRDILLKQAIIELIDNSIDGARKIKKDNDYADLNIEVEFNNNYFLIKDNCGGIPLDTAENYAFRFGRSKEKPKSETETTGIFGIGMKRALFKIGNYFEITSKTKTEEFTIQLDVDEWKKDDDQWDFSFADIKENQTNELGSTGTNIKVTRLNAEIAAEFQSQEFEKEVIEHIQRRVGLDISYGMNIRVNGNLLIGNNVKMVKDEKVKPIKESYEQDGVNVTILGGIAPREGTRYLPENAGWYIYCNGRLVIAADKTSLTTWKDMENKSSGIVFHNSYAGFRGVVYFTSKEPEKLPWNTTKTGLDETSLVYLKAREKMLEVFKIVRSFLDEVEKNTKDNDDGIQETIAKMPVVELTNQNTKNMIHNRELSIKQIEVKVNPNVTISYRKPKSEVEELKNSLGVTSNKEVGEKTFEYYKDAEC